MILKVWGADGVALGNAPPSFHGIGGSPIPPKDQLLRVPLPQEGLDDALGDPVAIKASITVPKLTPSKALTISVFRMHRGTSHSLHFSID